ncbi:MAG: hypothetical protein ABSB15_04900 [Bryobacteraceae bacterium]
MDSEEQDHRWKDDDRIPALGQNVTATAKKKGRPDPIADRACPDNYAFFAAFFTAFFAGAAFFGAAFFGAAFFGAAFFTAFFVAIDCDSPCPSL